MEISPAQTRAGACTLTTNVAPKSGSYTLLPPSEKVLAMGDSPRRAKTRRRLPTQTEVRFLHRAGRKVGISEYQLPSPFWDLEGQYS